MENLSISETIKIIAILIASLGLFLNFWQLLQSNKLRRVELVSKTLFLIFDDKDIANIFYKLEYDEFKYNDNFHGSKDEKKVDKLLTALDILGKQHNIGLISLKDVETISYEILTVYHNKELNKYLNFLDNWYKSKKLKKIPFNDFRQLAKKIETDLK